MGDGLARLANGVDTQHHLPRTTWVPGDTESNGGDPGRTAFTTHCSALRATVNAFG